MDDIARKDKYLIELWKTECEHCEEVRPVVEKLEKEGLVFEKHDIDLPESNGILYDYVYEIDENNRLLGYQQGYVYTPTFINPETRRILAFADRAPTKEELLRLASHEA